MRDAIGGVVSINLIIFFLFLINGYLAYSVNYTKAFRVKNKIINIIEEYEGHTQAAQTEIFDYINEAKYIVPARMVNALNSSGYTCYETRGYCISSTPAGSSTNKDDDGYRGWNYKVVTFVNIDIPVLNQILPTLGNFLQVVGETKAVDAEVGLNSCPKRVCGDE